MIMNANANNMPKVNTKDSKLFLDKAHFLHTRDDAIGEAEYARQRKRNRPQAPVTKTTIICARRRRLAPLYNSEYRSRRRLALALADGS